MGKADEEARARRERARAVALFRYQLIREAADPALTAKQRGVVVREISERMHTDAFGAKVSVSRGTLDRWIRAWRIGGFEALVPPQRQVTARTPAEVLELAASLKRENPDRTAAQIVRIMRAHAGWSPSVRTPHRHFDRLELDAGPHLPAVFGRFEADRPNELWTGDALHGPIVGGRKTYLFAFIDDHSRAIVGHRWGVSEDSVRLAAALRPALAARGVPDGIYVDNGSAFVDAALLRACARLGIKLIHSTPGRPQGRGKIERFSRTVRDQFLVELAGGTIGDLNTLNRHFTSWVEAVYHRRVHTEIAAAPLACWEAGAPFATPTPAQSREAFRWQETRTVKKTATVSLHGDIYNVDADLVGRRVDLVFDPFDLTLIEVRVNGQPAGMATPHHIGRHSHPKARPEIPDQPAQPTGIDYLNLVDAAYSHQLAGRINYDALTEVTPADLNAHDAPTNGDIEAKDTAP